ncbi:hypothetical protein BYT27DRAFT_7205968 [Phlegmacium glaucopus]|nr:hypothetical protein BYT27DRAFT_7205968 [Phlegmacium glaucopus]
MSNASPPQIDLDARAAIIADRMAFPEALKPPKPLGRTGFRLGREAASDLFPMKSLPKGLHVRPGYRLQPPKLCYGWLYTNEQLEVIGEKEGFLVKMSLHPGVSIEVNVSTLDTQHLLQHAVRDRLGITSIIPELCVPSGNPCALICIWTNWNDSTENPPEEEVERIRLFLGFDEPPAWYLDGEGDGKWACLNFKRVLVPRTKYPYGLGFFKVPGQPPRSLKCPECVTRPL